MRTLPAGLTALLALPSYAICRLVAITRKDGTVVRFAESQNAVIASGNTYTAAKGIRMSSLPYTLNALRNSVDFEVAAVDGGTIDPDDLRNGRYDHAAVVISVAENAATTANVAALFRGHIGEVEISDRGLTKIEIVGLLSKARDIPIEHYTPTCRTEFGDERCKVDLAPLTQSATITNVSGFSVVISGTAAGQASDYWNLGLIIPTSGAGLGDAFEIRDWDTSTNTLLTYLPTAGKLAASDTVNLTPGCDFTRAMCRDRWNNIVNFRGEPDVPGADTLAIDYTDWGP